MKCSKCVVHVNNVYVISRTVALRDIHRNILECYITIFMCNNFSYVQQGVKHFDK